MRIVLKELEKIDNKVSLIAYLLSNEFQFLIFVIIANYL